jgi:hypothetical protein
MLVFLIGNILVMFGGHVFHRIGIPNLWIQTVLLFSSTCLSIHMRQTSCKDFSRIPHVQIQLGLLHTLTYTPNLTVSLGPVKNDIL